MAEEKRPMRGPGRNRRGMPAGPIKKGTFGRLLKIVVLPYKFRFMLVAH